MSKSIWVVILILVLGGGYLFLSGSFGPSELDDADVVKDETVVDESTPTTEEAVVEDVFDDDAATAGDEEGTIVTVFVTYTDTGFEPADIEVKVGTTVKLVNESSKDMWVASAIHPTHELLPAFDQLESVSNTGEYMFKFETVGEWAYHNHVGPSDTGKVTVTE